MTETAISAAERALLRHSLAALKDLASTLGSYVPEGESTHEGWARRIAAVWNEPAAAVRLSSGLSEESRNLLAVLAWGPCDRSIDSLDLARLCRILGCRSTEPLHAPIAFGAIIPSWSASETDTLALSVRKKLVEDGCYEGISLSLWPTMAERLSAPVCLSLPESMQAHPNVRTAGPCDMAEWAARLIALWQSASLNSLRRTQTGSLHKKDRDALLRDAIIAEPPQGWPGGSKCWTDWFIDTMIPAAVRLGVLIEEPELYRPAPVAWWSEESIHLQERFARLATCRLDADSGAIAYGTEPPTPEMARLIPWLPSIVLADLASRPENEWIDLDEYLDTIAELVAQESACDFELVRSADDFEPDTSDSRLRRKDEPTRTQPTDRSVVDALRYWIAGPARLAGLVEWGSAANDSVAVCATELARFLTGHGLPPKPAVAVEKALLLQPNLEGILYRQSMTGQNLPRIARLLRLTSIGPVIQVKLDETWSRRLFGSGFSRERAETELAEISAVPLARSVLETYRTWAGKADRIRVHSAATLLEPLDVDDMPALLTMMSDRQLRTHAVGERLLVIEESDRIPFDCLRLVAQQDHAQKAQVCVRPIDDGTLLEIDMAKSDIALEPELIRFTHAASEEASPWSAPRRLYRIDRESLAAARNSGVTEAWLKRFFERRTGEPVPASVRLLWACSQEGVEGRPEPAFRIRETCILKTERAEVLDGLTCLSETAGLIGERLGPTVAEVSKADLSELIEIARGLGIRLSD